jgi:hypothetical protein
MPKRIPDPDSLDQAIAREIAMGRAANQPDRVTANRIVELFRRWDIGEPIDPA